MEQRKNYHAFMSFTGPTGRKIGDPAPLFTLNNDREKSVALSDFLGKQPVLLIFYPGDFTPGCTLHLCGIRDEWQGFCDARLAVFGVNHADANQHRAFRETLHLPFSLLADEEKRVSTAYGAVRPLFRATVIKRTVVGIDENGIIRFYRYGMPRYQEIFKAMKPYRETAITHS